MKMKTSKKEYCVNSLVDQTRTSVKLAEEILGLYKANGNRVNILPRGVLLEFLGGDVPLGLWNP